MAGVATYTWVLNVFVCRVNKTTSSTQHTHLYRAIDKFVDEWKASGNPLHLLVHCAGVMLPPHGSTEDGFEMQIGVNHIATAHLTKLLTDTLIANAPTRVVICSHSAAARGKMTGIDLMCV